MRISIFGLGYVGCVAAGCIARAGHHVIGVDVVPAKVEQLSAGIPTVVEPKLDELIAGGHKQGRIEATLDARRANPMGGWPRCSRHATRDGDSETWPGP